MFSFTSSEHLLTYFLAICDTSVNVFRPVVYVSTDWLSLVHSYTLSAQFLPLMLVEITPATSEGTASPKETPALSINISFQCVHTLAQRNKRYLPTTNEQKSKAVTVFWNIQIPREMA